MITLTLRPGGILEREIIDPSEKKHVIEDVTSQAMCHLFYPLEIADDTLLKDLFLVMSKNIDLFDSLFGNWCKEWVVEGLKPAKKPEDLKSICLEHSFSLYDVSKKITLEGTEAPKCSLLGVDNATYGFGAINIAEIAQLKLELRQQGKIHTEKSDLTFDSCSYTLGQVIQGIIWELSWYGSPTKNAEFWKEISSRLEDTTSDSLEEFDPEK